MLLFFKVFTGEDISADGNLFITMFNEKTEVTMATLTPEIVNSYIETGEPM